MTHQLNVTLSMLYLASCVGFNVAIVCILPIYGRMWLNVSGLGVRNP